MANLVLALGVGASLPADARPRHHRHALRHVGYLPHHARYGFAVRRSRLPPLAGTVGTAIPPYAARFMGYPYNVPGYRYEYADRCVLRVGGPFGPGPSIGKCFPALGF